MATNNTVKVTFVGKDALTPVMAGINNSVASFKQNATTGFGLAAGMKFQNMAFVAMDKIKDVLIQSVKDASNLEQAYGKLDAVLKGHTESLIEFGKVSAAAYGLSARQVYEYAGGIANLMQVSGISVTQSAKMSEALVRLAGDVAAFNNRDVQEVLVAFNAGLVGEAEPARRLGVILSQARIENYLLAQGFVKTKAEITDAMKIMARYNLILIDTKNQQGQFARESDNFMTKQMVLAATFENLSGKLGNMVIDAIIPYMQALVDLSEIVDTVTTGFGLMTDAANLLKPALDAIKATLDIFTLQFLIQGISALHDVIVPATDDAYDFQGALVDVKDGLNGTGEAADNASKSLVAFKNLQSPEDYTKFSPKQLFKDLKEQIQDFRKEIRWLNNHPNYMDKLFRSYMKLTSSDAFKKLQEIAKQLGESSPQYGLVSNIVGFGIQQFGTQGAEGPTKWTTIGRKLGKLVNEGFQNEIDEQHPGRKMVVAIQAQIYRSAPLLVPFTLTYNSPGRTNSGTTFPGGRPYRPGPQPVDGTGSGGGEAFGGRASPYKTYLVGERGPEWLTMGAQSGFITPNAGGGDITVNIDGEKLFKIVNRRLGRAVAMGV